MIRFELRQYFYSEIVALEQRQASLQQPQVIVNPAYDGRNFLCRLAEREAARTQPVTGWPVVADPMARQRVDPAILPYRVESSFHPRL